MEMVRVINLNERERVREEQSERDYEGERNKE